jgi:short-subunit dehydrogenase
VQVRFEGRVAIITGASSGIGRAVALALARAGCDVALVARRQENLESVATEIRALGRRALPIPMDMRDEVAVKQMPATVEQALGRVDILVNNAGIGLQAPVVEARPEDVRHIFALNVIAVVDAIQAVVPAMRRQGGGMIVNIASVAGLIPVPGNALYSATKFALRALSEAVRVELKADHIHVFAVYPGPIITEFGSKRLGSTARPSYRVGRGSSVEGLAVRIVKGMGRDQRAVIFPWVYRPLWWGSAALPPLRDWAFAYLKARRQRKRS